MNEDEKKSNIDNSLHNEEAQQTTSETQSDVAKAEPNEAQIQEGDDEKMVNEAFDALLESYLNSRHRKKVDIIKKAFNFARQAHKGVRRLSGEPYIMHPIAVAMIASSEMGLGSTSICSALLHDVVEDTDYTVEDIENIFGQKIAQIVDGLTKISGGIFGEQASAQAENFKKLLLTMSNDIRVILIKICDRLHNMRTLESQPANKQYKIAGETLYIYAPLANRLGLNKIKSELEDLSFRYEHPDDYNAITSKLKLSQDEREELFRQFTTPIREALDRMGLDYDIKARVKSPYSIWKKMQNKHLTFEEVYDILAVRIVFRPKAKENELNDCYNIYVELSKLYRKHPDRIRDWLGQPKANGYQALHATFMSNQGRWVEVQIRSERMDEIAEQGFAAHWKYKDAPAENIEDESELNDWLRTIKEILDDPQPDAMDFLDAVKLNLFASEIYVFTPKGDVMNLPIGCTALDFAFQIHTFLGTHCMGAKVNHKLVPLSYKLQSGDQIEIITSNTQRVKEDWLGYVSTAKAKSKIQAILRKQNRETQKVGETMLKDFLANHDIEMTTPIIQHLCDIHDIRRPENFFLAIGDKTIVLTQSDIDSVNNRNKNKKKSSWRRFVPFMSDGDKKEQSGERLDAPELITAGKDFNKKKPIYVTEENIKKYIFRECCHPIPGDDALGFINDDKQIEIHLRSCPIANKLKSSYGNRILDAKWGNHWRMHFNATIQIRGIDRMGMLKEVTEVLSDKLNIMMRKIIITSEDGIFDGTIDLRVHDRHDVSVIINRLKNIEDLKEVMEIQ